MLIKGFTGFAQKCEKHTKCMEEASDKFLKTFGGNFFHFYSTLKVSTTELRLCSNQHKQATNRSLYIQKMDRTGIINFFFYYHDTNIYIVTYILTCH